MAINIAPQYKLNRNLCLYFYTILSYNLHKTISLANLLWTFEASLHCPRYLNKHSSLISSRFVNDWYFQCAYLANFSFYFAFAKGNFYFDRRAAASLSTCRAQHRNSTCITLHVSAHNRIRLVSNLYHPVKPTCCLIDL